MAKKGLNIYKRKDGRWEGRYKCGYTADGKSMYRSVYAKSYSAVREILIAKKAEGNAVLPRYTETMGNIAQLWISDIKNKVKESTLANYAMKLEKHILPCFAGLKYDMLTAQMLNDFIEQKLAGGLSSKYVSDIVVIIKSIAKFVEKNYGYANRIESVSLPKSRKSEEKPLLTDTEQVKLRRSLINNSTPSNMGILLASITGIRIGELCALKWSDIDFEKKFLTVSKTVQRIKNNTSENATKVIISEPKSVSSNRIIPLPEFILPILKLHKSDNFHYILSGNLKPVEPRTMQYRFSSLLKKLKLPKVCFHALRHMFATNCITLGFDVKTLSEILGHSTVEITLNRYVHSSFERKISCMKLLSERLFSA